MKKNFEIEKELKFNTNLAEILSISLEEKHEVEENKIVGWFIVSGEYKIHEISLNKEKFSFKIPYDLDLTSDIDLDTINVEISNFIYDNDKENLFVTINYEVTGDRKDILLFDDEENLDEFLKSREVELIMDESINKIDEVIKKEKSTDQIIEELDELILKNEDICNDSLETVENDSIKQKISEDEIVLEENARNMEEAKKQLLNNVSVNDDNFITYQIHIVKENDSLETILSKYKVSLEELKEYNEFNSLSLGMKLIIPIINE